MYEKNNSDRVSGGGKSTFSRKLAKIKRLPVYHLGNLFWNADKTMVNQYVFDRRLQDILKLDQWMIDGIIIGHFLCVCYIVIRYVIWIILSMCAYRVL